MDTKPIRNKFLKSIHSKTRVLRMRQNKSCLNLPRIWVKNVLCCCKLMAFLPRCEVTEVAWFAFFWFPFPRQTLRYFPSPRQQNIAYITFHHGYFIPYRVRHISCIPRPMPYLPSCVSLLELANLFWTDSPPRDLIWLLHDHYVALLLSKPGLHLWWSHRSGLRTGQSGDGQEKSVPAAGRALVLQWIGRRDPAVFQQTILDEEQAQS